jgi:hypothetical protein
VIVNVGVVAGAEFGTVFAGQKVIRITLSGWRRNIEVARRIVEGVTVDRGTGLLHACSAIVPVPVNVVASLRRSIRATAALVPGSIQTAQALAAYHLAGATHNRLSDWAGFPEIHLAGGIHSVGWVGIIQLNGERKIEGVHEANIVIVAACARAGERKFGQARTASSGVLTLQQPPAISGCTRTLGGAVERALTPPPEAAAHPRHGHRSADCRTSSQFESTGDPSNTGTGLPAPATHTFSVQSFLMVNSRVCAPAVPDKAILAIIRKQKYIGSLSSDMTNQ